MPQGSNATIGLAVVVSAGGAQIDNFNANFVFSYYCDCASSDAL